MFLPGEVESLGFAGSRQSNAFPVRRQVGLDETAVAESLDVAAPLAFTRPPPIYTIHRLLNHRTGACIDRAAFACLLQVAKDRQ
ncbi:hypothetical protein AWC16_20025 [Mycolicibacter longobardus]|uniref:Uncharacterized protein n=1 Tax=Mycolicibacter longobardus TaxID=1108812 RepID=A0A1X1YAA8_9MYCO|nr:hypothetical protein AWC16_20025 [Mycolicibacter longobardus]